MTRKRKPKPLTAKCIWPLSEFWLTPHGPEEPPAKRDGQCLVPIPKGGKLCPIHTAMNRIKWLERSDPAGYQLYLQKRIAEREDDFAGVDEEMTQQQFEAEMRMQRAQALDQADADRHEARRQRWHEQERGDADRWSEGERDHD